MEGKKFHYIENCVVLKNLKWFLAIQLKQKICHHVTERESSHIHMYRDICTDTKHSSYVKM